MKGMTVPDETVAMNRLYHVPLSPFCRKVRLTLAEKRIEVELVEERYWEPTPDFLRRNPAGKVPVLRMDSRVMSESQAICEYLEETVPTPPLMPRDADGRYEVRRLCAWFDDKFHDEVTSKLLYERVNKKVTGQGYPDSARTSSPGPARIKYHLDYHGLAAGSAALAGGGRDDAGRFHRGGASVLSGLHLGCGLEPACGGEGLVCQDQVAAQSFRPLAGRSGAGLSAAGALCRSGFLSRDAAGGCLPPDPRGYLCREKP